jgi:hypothetical protein
MSDPLLRQQVGDVEITLRSVLLDPPADDPGYDFLFAEAFVVETSDCLVGIKATYEDYATALDRYQREVAYYATNIAKKALRIRP